jgi:hypothetical protein
MENNINELMDAFRKKNQRFFITINDYVVPTFTELSFSRSQQNIIADQMLISPIATYSSEIYASFIGYWSDSEYKIDRYDPNGSIVKFILEDNIIGIGKLVNNKIYTLPSENFVRCEYTVVILKFPTKEQRPQPDSFYQRNNNYWYAPNIISPPSVVKPPEQGLKKKEPEQSKERNLPLMVMSPMDFIQTPMIKEPKKSTKKQKKVDKPEIIEQDEDRRFNF